MKNIRNLKFRIYSFEVRLLALISEGLINGKNKQQILRMLKKECLLFVGTVKLTDNEKNMIWKMCINMYNVLAKKVRGKRRNAETVYLSIRSLISSVEQFKNALGKNIEIRDKENYLNKLLSRGVFYLCSEHSNCAEGHLDFQGKIYISKDWEERCPEELKKSVKYYIKNHDCKTVEEIVSGPVYMVTRPNCRHYFRRVSLDEVLHGSKNKLLKKYDMKKSGVSSYEYLQYRKYYERLKVLIALRKICECDLLEKDIKETRVIMKKWLSVIR